MRDEDIKYIHELEERVQELEEENERLCALNIATTHELNHVDKINKRYREAREIIEQEYKEHNVGVVYGYEDGYLDGLDTAIGIIDKALEGEEK